jgi:hypothetical protein
MSTDFDTPVSTLMFGFFTDTFMGVSQTGNLRVILKLSMEGFNMVEPKAPIQAPLTMVRQADVDNGDGVKASDITLPVASSRVKPVEQKTEPTSTVKVTPEANNADEVSIPLVKVNKPPKKIPSVYRDRGDAIMSTELLKTWQRVINFDVSDWTGQLFSVYELLMQHRGFRTWATMFRFFHGGARFKVRVMSDDASDLRAIRVAFRGMYGEPTSTALTYQIDTLGNLSTGSVTAGNRGAFAELCINQVGEQLDFEIPYTWMGDTLTLAHYHNLNSIPGYDFGEFYLAANKTISTATITIDVSTSDDATFSCFVFLPEYTFLYDQYPNSFPTPPDPPPPELKESSDETDIEVVSITSTIKDDKTSAKRALRRYSKRV